MIAAGDNEQRPHPALVQINATGAALLQRCFRLRQLQSVPHTGPNVGMIPAVAYVLQDFKGDQVAEPILAIDVRSRS
jgi:hypothetical protein